MNVDYSGSNFDDDIVQRLYDAAIIGCNMSECALYANVSRAALYRFLSKNESVRDKIDLLRNDTTIAARRTVRQSIIEDKDPITAKWYLERKASNEFTVKHDIDINAAGSLTIEDKEKQLESFLTALTGSQAGSNSKSEE